MIGRFPVYVSWGSFSWYDGGDSYTEDPEWYDVMVNWGGAGEGADARQGELLTRTNNITVSLLKDL